MAFRRSGVRIPSGPPIAVVLFAGVWSAAAASLVVRGLLEEVVLAAFTAVVVIIGTALSFLVARRPPLQARRRDRRTSVQAIVLMAVVVFSCVRFGPPWLTGITGWGRLPGWAYLIVVFVLPLMVVLMLGAKPAGIGLVRGYRSFAVASVWVALRALMLAPAILTGQGLSFAGMFLLHLIGVGFPEELVFRGLLQTRLASLLGSACAVVLTGLLFGLWHLGINTSAHDGDLATGVAHSILVQGTLGLGYSVAFARTRSVIAPALAHAAFNAN